jgi:glycosyltransferase involved in cell wall biosynthesis
MDLNGPLVAGRRLAATARTLRILVAHDVARARNGGMSRLMGYVHDQVAARGVAIDYFCTDDRTTHAPSRIARLTFPLAVYRHARTAARAGGPYDIINVHEPAAAAVIGGRRSLGNPAVVVTTHGIERRGWQRTLEESRLGREPLPLRTRMSYPLTTLWQADYGLRHADHIFCLNFEDRDYLLEHYGRSLHDVMRIYPGAASVYAIGARRRDYGRARTILFAGTWLARKGIRDLSAAFTMALARNPDLRLCVLGSGADLEIVRAAFLPETRAAIQTTSAAGEERSAAAFADADIYVLPSLFEGTPLTLIEAMASGLPIITTATCGMRDVIRDNENGLLVPLRSPEAIANAIQRLVDDRSLRERLGRTAAAEANRSYTWEQVALPVAEIYARLRPPA